jgi:hypothetical protein
MWHNEETKLTNLCQKEWTEIQKKGTENLFNEIIAENSPNLGEKWLAKYKRHLELQIHMTWKEPLHDTL